MENLNKIIAQNLVNLRKKAGLTQSQLAEKFSFSDKTISKWELGNAMPAIDVLKDIADFYGVSVDYLLEEHEETADVDIKKGKRKIDNRVPILLMVNMAIILVATVIFVWSFNDGPVGYQPLWQIFIFALALCGLISTFVARRFWRNRKAIWITFASIFTWTTLLGFFLVWFNLWYIFFVGIPVQGILIIFATMKKA